MKLKAFVLMGSLLTGIAPSAMAQTTLLLSTFFPKGHALTADVLVPWAKDVEKQTNGAVKVEFSPSSLAPPPSQMEMVQKGIADISAQYSGLVPNRLHLPLLSEVPGVATTSEAMSVAMWRTYERYFRPANEFKGVKLLGLLVFPPQGFWGVTDQPIVSIEQLKQSRIATTPGIHARAYGAVTTGVTAGPAFRYFELVSKGTVDAYAAATPLDVIGFNLARYTKNLVKLKGVGTGGSFALVMNEGKWKALSPAVQAEFAKVCGETFARRMSALDRAAAANMDKLREQGLKVVDAPDSYSEALQKAFAFIATDWIAEAKKRGVDGAAALNYYRSEQTKLANSVR